jgi:hypothetical protein
MQNKPTKFLASLYGGIVIATISSVPGLNLLNCLCCAGVMLGGLVAVFVYSRELTPETPPLSAGDGVQLGALSGVMAAFLSLILHLVVYALFGNIAERIIYELVHSILDATNVPPETIQMFEEIFHQALERGLTPLVVFFSLVQDLILFALFGLLGGLIGYAIFKKRGQQIQPAAPAS